jgi:hypothetical protein
MIKNYNSLVLVNWFLQEYVWFIHSSLIVQIKLKALILSTNLVGFKYSDISQRDLLGGFESICFSVSLPQESFVLQNST